MAAACIFAPHNFRRRTLRTCGTESCTSTSRRDRVCRPTKASTPHPPSSQNLQPAERMASRTSTVSETLMPC
jgi:hypothetical protein